jgi:uncharacterized protein HemX
MNHKKMTLGLVAIVAAVALTASTFAIPQQAMAYKHHHHNNNNGINVDQQINQLNACTNSSFCENNANNNVDIHR